MGAATTSALELRADGRQWLVPAGSALTIGRSDDSDVQLDDPTVSRRHAVITSTAAGWRLVDHSRNGTFLRGRRIDELIVREEIELRLGHATEGVLLALVPCNGDGAVTVTGAPRTHAKVTGVQRLQSSRIRIGRLPLNDVVLDDDLVSRQHAELHRTGDGWQLVDLDSSNGTYVNGRRVIGPTTVGPHEMIGIGHSLLQIVDGRLVVREDSGDVGFTARDLVVRTRNGDRLLDGVSFRVPQRGLLAVVGPSGSGKSTLLRALTGFRPADSGSVEYGGRDLYTNYDELRQRIGLVPQDDILHPQLTVRRALLFAARLRFPSEIGPQRRAQRVDELLVELGLHDHAHKRITDLSGGQRKRTSVALELLTRPSLLFLDEPTSGLDPGLDKSVMQTLRQLADEGRTVVVVTHNMANLDVCDRLLFLGRGGQTVFYGRPDEVFDYFGKADHAEIFQLLEQDTHTDWAAKYRQSAMYDTYVGIGGAPESAAPPAVGAPPRQQSPWRQFTVLCRRSLAVIAADRQYLGFLIALPLLLSALAHAVPAGEGPNPAISELAKVLLVLVVGGALMGSAASVRELVKEREIYRRERAIGLSLSAYLGSKLLLLGVITGIEALVFTFLGLLGRDPVGDGVTGLGSPGVEITLAVLLGTITSMIAGLLISAAIANADRGMPLLVLVVMLQLILSGGLFPVDHRIVLEQLAWLVPARWAYAMGAATVDLAGGPPASDDPLWRHDVTTWLGDACVLAAISVTLVIITSLLLRRLEPQRGR